MIHLSLQNIDAVQEMFLNPSTIELDSPLLSGERMDESKVCLSKFGHIRLCFSDASSTLLIEKITQSHQRYKENSPYFFKPNWERQGDPYQEPSYHVHLKEWILQKGNLDISSSQQEVLFKILEMLKAKGLPVNFDEELKQSLVANQDMK